MRSGQNHLPSRILIALGGARAADGVINELSRAARKLHDFGMQVFGSPALAQLLGTECPEIEHFDFWDDHFDAMDLAIVRGRIGNNLGLHRCQGADALCR